MNSVFNRFYGFHFFNANRTLPTYTYPSLFFFLLMPLPILNLRTSEIHLFYNLVLLQHGIFFPSLWSGGLRAQRKRKPDHRGEDSMGRRVHFFFHFSFQVFFFVFSLFLELRKKKEKLQLQKRRLRRRRPRRR